MVVETFKTNDTSFPITTDPDLSVWTVSQSWSDSLPCGMAMWPWPSDEPGGLGLGGCLRQAGAVMCALIVVACETAARDSALGEVFLALVADPTVLSDTQRQGVASFRAPDVLQHQLVPHRVGQGRRGGDVVSLTRRCTTRLAGASAQ